MSATRLSQGLSFPFRLDYRTGGPQVSSSSSNDHEHIKESIRQILGTRIGERLMQPDFGSRLHELVFEGNDAVLRGLIRHYVIEAIRRWEKRVVVTDVTFCDSSENLLTVIVYYQIASSRIENSLAYRLNHD